MKGSFGVRVYVVVGFQNWNRSDAEAKSNYPLNRPHVLSLLSTFSKVSTFGKSKKTEYGRCLISQAYAELVWCFRHFSKVLTFFNFSYIDISLKRTENFPLYHFDLLFLNLNFKKIFNFFSKIKYKSWFYFPLYVIFVFSRINFSRNNFIEFESFKKKRN